MYAYHHHQHHCTTIPLPKKGADKERQSPIINKMTSISYWENPVFDTTRENLNIHKMKIELLNSMLVQYK
jgi:hypothetical protein